MIKDDVKEAGIKKFSWSVMEDVKHRERREGAVECDCSIQWGNGNVCPVNRSLHMKNYLLMHNFVQNLRRNYILLKMFFLANITLSVAN